jgi:hypothetical protein
VKIDCVPAQAGESAFTDPAIRSDIRAAANAASYTTFDLASGAATMRSRSRISRRSA